MTTLVETPRMSESEKKKSRPTTSMRVPLDLAEMIRVICGYRTMMQLDLAKPNEFLESLIRGPVEKEHARVQSESRRKRKKDE